MGNGRMAATALETLILQRDQQLVPTTKCRDTFNSAAFAGHIHDWAEAVNRMSRAGEIPFSAFARSHALRLGKTWLRPCVLNFRQLNLRDGE